MRILLTIPFNESLNNLPLSERGRCKGYLQKLYKWIKSVQDEIHISNIPFSNFYITFEKEISQKQYNMKLRVYQFQFDGFRLFITVSGSDSPVCKFIYIENIIP